MVSRAVLCIILITAVVQTYLTATMNTNNDKWIGAAITVLSIVGAAVFTIILKNFAMTRAIGGLILLFIGIHAGIVVLFIRSTTEPDLYHGIGIWAATLFGTLLISKVSSLNTGPLPPNFGPRVDSVLDLHEL